MRPLSLLACTALVFTLNSAAAELTLFDQVLRTATREQIRMAIERSGGQLTSTDEAVDSFDAHNMGIEGAKSLELAFLDGRFVLAKYTLNLDFFGKERLRTRLVTRYGWKPKLDQQRWDFDGDMQLVLAIPFSSEEGFLTYVHRGRLAALETQAKATDRNAALRRDSANSGTN